ncbi:Survivin-1 [Operophtera brumata]|uniref:Survivin-1 n=1 Tax=Operophtera brumata TaxID=104452 RepID=A0A0L7LQQ0_OPEBR|nr:Survivin-1 [Operophtera brumata]
MDLAPKLLEDASPTHSGTASVLKSASDTAISTVVGAWELSLAAASASKDKRIKDVKNTSLKQQNSKKRTTKNDSGMSVSEAKMEACYLRQHDWIACDIIARVTPSAGLGYEVVELGASTATSNSDESAQAGIPAHALVALGLLLKLPGYAAALLDEGAKAVHLLRLLLGVAHTEDGRSIAVSGGGTGGAPAWSLGTLPFRVVCVLLERSARRSPAGVALRASLLHCGAARLLLACLSNSQASNGSTGKSEEKSQLYWAKGTGFGTGSTQQSWNVEQALHRQRTEEEHVTVLLQVLSSYMNPGEVWPPEETGPEALDTDEPAPEEDADEDPSADLPQDLFYFAVLDMSRHIPLYVCVLRVARALHALRSPRLAAALRPLPRLLAMMTTTTNSYAAKLRKQ